MTTSDLHAAIKALNRDQLKVLSAVSGIAVARLKEISKGKAPTFTEQMILEALA